MAAKTTARKHARRTAKSSSRPARSAKTGKKAATSDGKGRRHTGHSAATKHSADSQSAQTPPAASIAAAQKVLVTIERRESTLRKALKKQKDSLKQVSKTAARHRATVKSLQSDLDDVKATRKKVARQF